MNRILLTLFMMILISSIRAQDAKRLVIEGKINAQENNIEGVVVFNSSANIGTVTNANGEFTLSVALNDMIEFSALQYQNYTLVINQEIIKSQIMNVFLVEQINALNEVVLLPSGLTGNLKIDTDGVKKPLAIAMNLGDLSDMEFPVDHLTKVDNTQIKKGQLYNGVNFARLLGLNKLLFGTRKKAPPINVENELETDLLLIFSSNYINLNFNIPLNKIHEFIAFMVSKGLDTELFKDEKKMELIEFMVVHSKLYLHTYHAKD